MTNKEEDNLYLAELEAFDKDRLVAWQNLELYHQKIPTIQYTCLASIISKKKKEKRSWYNLGHLSSYDHW